jgi:tol-pal system protein YbgF
MQGILLRYKWMASLALAIAFTVPAQAQTQTSSSREQMVDMVLQLQQLQDEVRVLRGQIEEQAHLIETLQRRQRDQYLDLDQRIGELTGMRPPASAGPTVGAGPAAPPQEDLPEVQEARRQPSTVSTLPTPDTSARAVSEGPAAEKAAYDKAFQALKELRYAEAAEQFRSFLQNYPQSEYAGNAQYWLGESYYVTRNYEFALEAFQGLLDSYPDSTKAPDSLLKVGYTHYELKQWDLARAALTQVQEQYPNTTVARLAENRLRSMRLEGHY